LRLSPVKIEVFMTFQALGLPERICSALARNKITSPTSVQKGAIPAALLGRDILSSARTGSGKTLAYALPLLTRLHSDNRRAALVLVPTREIAVQVHQVMAPYLHAIEAPPPALVIGGVSFGPQIQSLRRRPPVIIATPGRLNDHLGQGGLRLDHVQALVLDEADRMLDMGFLPQVKRILQHLRPERQTMLFSATMPNDLARACNEMLRDPERIAVDAPNTANVAIEQRMFEVDSTLKAEALLDHINESTESVLVFTRTKRRTDRVARQLAQYGVAVERIHGDRSQPQRQRAIELFRSGRVKVLVATDIAARGIDIPLVELVINFDLPETREDYVHRIGRTGRAGARGTAVSFVSPEERGHWASLSGQKKSAAAPTAQERRPSHPHASRPQKRDNRPSHHKDSRRPTSRWSSKAGRSSR
jgi:superfamily II DNA/RNA helicase